MGTNTAREGSNNNREKESSLRGCIKNYKERWKNKNMRNRRIQKMMRKSNNIISMISNHRCHKDIKITYQQLLKSI